MFQETRGEPNSPDEFKVFLSVLARGSAKLLDGTDHAEWAETFLGSCSCYCSNLGCFSFVGTSKIPLSEVFLDMRTMLMFFLSECRCSWGLYMGLHVKSTNGLTQHIVDCACVCVWVCGITRYTVSSAHRCTHGFD